jgi:hypothetical protein
VGAFGSIRDGRLDEGEIQVSEYIEQFYRDATADDVAEIMRTGKPIEARFRNQDDEDWEYNWLCGWESSLNYLDELANPRKHCQVYDPPAWFLNKPEPGEGWRLLEKFPHEPKLETDEAWQKLDKCWKSVINNNGIQADTTWYRRRIANPPISPNSSRSRDTIPSGFRVLGKNKERLASDAYWSQGCKEWVLIGNDRVEYANRDRWPAIRQVVYYDHRELRVNGVYSMPGGQTIRITAKGFEVL